MMKSAIMGGWSANRKLAYTGVLLGKKSRLRGRILRVAKVGQANANKAEPLLRAQADAFPEGEGNIRQLLARSRWSNWRVAAGENLELAGFQFQYNSAGEDRKSVV